MKAPRTEAWQMLVHTQCRGGAPAVQRWGTRSAERMPVVQGKREGHWLSAGLPYTATWYGFMYAFSRVAFWPGQASP